MNTDASRPLPDGLPHIACILLWYPLFTQPFIFREVENLKQRLPVEIYTLYASNLRYCSAEMRAAAGNVRTAGMRRLPCFCFDVLRGFLTQPALLWRLLKRSLFRRWRNFETFAENLWAFCAGVSLGRLLRDDGIDMLYAPWPRGTATAAWVAANIADIPFATAARGDNLEPADPDLGAKFEAALFIRANNAADRARIESFDHGQAKNKVALIYNSLTLPPPAAARQNCGLRPVRLLALGRFDVTKGFDVLLAACDVLQRNGLNFHLTLAGGGGKVMGLGGMEAQLVTMRKNLGLESRVEMPGLISHDDLPGILRNHDIFVAPCVVHASGRRDGIPNTVIEALAYGLPVISTTVNALPEVVRDQETGLVVPPGNPEALAGAVFRLAQNPDEALRMGRNGMLLAAEMFDPERNSRRLAELFVSQHALWKKSCAA